MKSSQSLLCLTCRHDTTRCPISGILRRCAERQQSVQSLRTMHPQSPAWHRHREGSMSLSASRRRRGEDRWYGEPRGTREKHRHRYQAQEAGGLSQHGDVAGTRTPVFLVMGINATGGQSAPHPSVVTETEHGNPVRLPQGKAHCKARREACGKRRREKAKAIPSWDWIGVELRRNITLRESGLTSLWSFVT
jgi:hypothetical protein